MKEVYIAVISKINGLDRLTFSMIINDYVKTLPPEVIPPVEDLTNGICLKPSDIQSGIFVAGKYYSDNRAITLFNGWLCSLKSNPNLWSPWMKTWTDGTLYVLYGDGITC